MAARQLGSLDARQFSVYLSPDVARQVREHAVQSGLNLSSLFETAIRQYFARLAFIEAAGREYTLELLAVDAAEAIRTGEGKA